VVAEVVPGESPHRAAHRNLQALGDGGRQATDPLVCLGIGGTLDPTVRPDRNDLLIRIDVDGLLIKGGKQQRKIVLHVRHQFAPSVRALFSCSNSSSVNRPSAWSRARISSCWARVMVVAEPPCRASIRSSRTW